MAGAASSPRRDRDMANASHSIFLTVQPSDGGVGNAGADENVALMRGTPMRDFRDAKLMAKAMREGLAGCGLKITHSEALEIVAHQLGYSNWHILAAKISESEPSQNMDGILLEAAVPILRIFDVEKAKEFYIGFLGFQVDWEHRYGDNFPLYMSGVTQLHKELHARDYRYMKPGLPDQGSRLELEVTDPFSNRIRFMQCKHP